MTAFTEAYAKLNAAQKQAVDSIEGPLLVIAGPGTGKTQLLSARVANIIQKTDTPAQNILCLTFTESGASNMRERLSRFIGQDAYSVGISTYHAFGSELITRYPEYFTETRLESAIDELSKRQIVLELVEAMAYDNPLKFTRHDPGDLIGTISELKRALLDSDRLRALAAENAGFITQGSGLIAPIFAAVAKMPSTFAKAEPLFQETLVALASLVPAGAVSKKFEPLATVCVAELQTALSLAAEKGKSSPLTKWKNDWLTKDADNHFMIAGELANKRILALADVLEAYKTALGAQGLYDFDDMILRSIEALKKYPDLRYSLQERYLYILLDEFQDTNAAQLELVKLLTDNPVHEGRPNVLAVGDDDQAIYAFQGAKYSNMRQYAQMYRDTAIINLTENYRSHADVLATAKAVASQISDSLETDFPDITKTLTAANTSIKTSVIERREFQSDIAERAWIGKRIKQLIDDGVSPREIAVLAPKHKPLEALVPYLNAAGVPVSYEKRENILDAPIVRQLLTMSQLLLALSSESETGEPAVSDALWPQVLSYDFWQIPIEAIWRLSWKIGDSLQSDSRLAWSRAILDSDNPQIKLAGQVLLGAATRVKTEGCEQLLDYLIGSSTVETHAGESVASPLRAYYTSADVQAKQPEIFYITLSHLTVLRARLREFQARSDEALMLQDLIRFVAMYEAAGQPMIDTSPYSQQADSVQLMTVFKAKGLEYQHVFLPNCLNDTWGGSSRGNTNKLSLPANLQPIRHAGATDDERLRILFVALTRARSGLHLTSAVRSFSGKHTTRLQYFDEQQQADGSFRTMILPEHTQIVASDDSEAPTAAMHELDWRTRHLEGLGLTSLKSLLAEHIAKYQLSPTDMVKFVNLEYAGPQNFFFDSILRFPSAPSVDSQYGTAIHETLEWYQHQVSELGFAPHLTDALDQFTVRIKLKKLTEQRTNLEIVRGRAALRKYLAQRGHIFTPEDVAEKNFRSEGVFIGDVHMSGKVDRLEIDHKNRTITVVDYKTGKSYTTWKKDIKSHRNRIQLYAYKLLIEGSRSYAGYTVTHARLEFIESDTDRIETLELAFNNTDIGLIKQLMEAVWQHVHELNFPDTSDYPATLAGITQFEDDLIAGTV